MRPLELLFERADIPRFGLTRPLCTLYGGDFGLEGACAYANFVSSLDGVVALPNGGESGRIVSGDNQADRFVMALLRACADAVVIGAGTFRRTPGALWYPENACPTFGQEFAELRAQLGLRPHPVLVVVTASGQLDTAHRALENALVATTSAGEQRLRGALPPATRIVTLGPHAVPVRSLFDLLRSEGLARVLTEGGPRLFGELIEADLVDELFLTASPRLFGRESTDAKKALIDGVELGPLPLELMSVRRHDSHLFLRYAIARTRA